MRQDGEASPVAPGSLADLVRWSPDEGVTTRYLQSEGDTFRWPIIVIDDFFREPDLVRDLALSLDYRRRRSGYPGLDASIAVPRWPLTQVMARACARVYGETWNIQVTGAGSRVSFGNDQQVPETQAVRATQRLDEYWRVPIEQLAGEDIVTFSILKIPEIPDFFPKSFDVGTPIAHCDRIQRDHLVFSVVVYLTRDTRHGGTVFMRHRDTGLVAMPAGGQAFLSKAMKRHGARTSGELLQCITWSSIRRTGRVDAWNIEENLAWKYNRLVAFPGNLLHSIDLAKPRSIPESLDEYRLTLNGFVDIYASALPGEYSD